MGIAYTCMPDRKLALVAWDGVVSRDEWFAHLQRMLADPDYAPMQFQITDLRHASLSATISSVEIQAMVDLIAGQRGRLSIARVAIVAGDEWARPRIAEAALESISVTAIVFNDLTTACMWLGVDAAAAAADMERTRLKLRPPA